MIAGQWESLNPLIYPRELPKAIASTKYKLIYIFGGCKSRTDNYLIEKYDLSKLEDIDP